MTLAARLLPRTASACRRALAAALVGALATRAAALPVIDPATIGLTEQTGRGAHAKLTVAQLGDCIVAEEGALVLVLDLSRAGRLTDGRELDAGQVTGTVCAGPWPFEAEESGFAYRRFRLESRVREGRAVLPLKGLLNENINSEGWRDGGTVMLRLELREARPGADAELALVDLPLRFRVEAGGVLRRLPALAEGPLLCRVDSRAPGTAVIALRTDLPAAVDVEIEHLGLTRASGPGPAHEIPLAKLPVDRDLRYRILLDGEAVTEWLSLWLPRPGAEPLRFAYFGDTREQHGGGDRASQGVNVSIMERMLGQAYARGAEALVFGGDLISGYTIWPADWHAQAETWKQAAVGFWRERPIFCAMGNHETLLRIYEGHDHNGRRIDWLGLDRWPYATESSEAAFAAALCNPENGPVPDDPELPGYRESVFSTRLGCVTFIVFNNTWWYTEHESLVGGCPSGYLLEDQLRWIEAEIRAAQADPACRYIVYCAHQPVFPTAGHVKDSMWHGGDNTVRAWRADGSGGLAPLGPGMLEVRNRLVAAMAACPKSAAVLAGHEHVYARLLMTPEVPAGDPSRDDADGDGRLCEPGEPCSPVPGLARGLWFITNGGGSPYYAEEHAPWNDWWRTQAQPERGFKLSSQEAVLIFEAGEKGLALTACNPFGEVIDHVPDLMAARR